MTDEPLDKLSKKKGKERHYNSFQQNSETIKTYFKNLYFTRLEDLKELGGCLDAFNVPISQNRTKEIVETSPQPETIWKR